MATSGAISAISLCALVLALSPRALAVEEQDDVVQDEEVSLEVRRKAAEERRLEVESFTSKLKEAKTPEERHALVEDFRSNMQATVGQNVSARKAQQSSSGSLAELKQKIAANPELKKRLATIEARLKAIEGLKEAMDAADKDPDDRARLMEEASKRRSELMMTQDALPAIARPVSRESDARVVPLQMAVLREKSEQRKCEVEAFNEALTMALPDERTQLLEGWRAKSQEEMNRQLAEMPR